MKSVKITVYTTPTCGGCQMLKKQIPSSEFNEHFDVQEINDTNRDFLKENNINSVPAIVMEVGTRSQIIVGYRPIQMIDGLIKEMINY